MLSDSKTRFTFLLSSLVLSSLILYQQSYDPSGFPKWLIIWVAIILAITPAMTFLIRVRGSRRLLAFFSLTIALLSLLIALTSADSYQGIYGTFQRYNGSLLFVLLLSILLVSASSYDNSKLPLLIRTLLVLSAMEIVIGIAQWQGFQLIKSQNLYSPILGTFGNPNHLSAFLGFGMTVAIYVILFTRRDKLSLWLSIGVIPFSIFVMWKSQSIQGFFSFAVGASLLVLLALRNRRSMLMSASSLIVITGGFAFAGLANKGPLSKLLFQDSNLYRYDYWRGAIAAIRQRPFFGYGPDQFADAYAVLRDNTAIRRRSTIVTDNAHNWPLQISATYGMIFAVFFLLFLVFIATVSIRQIRISKTITQAALPLSLWISSLIQTLISVEHSTITGWGFLFGGALFASSQNVTEDSGKRKKVRSRTEKLTAPLLISQTLVFLLGILIILPPIKSLSLLTTIDRKYSSQGSLYEARTLIANLDSVSPLGHGDRKIWLTLANIRYSTGDVAGAELILKSIRTNFPRETEALNYLAQLETNRGNARGALVYRQQLNEINGKNVENQKGIMALAIQLRDLNAYTLAKADYLSIMGVNALPKELVWIN